MTTVVLDFETYMDQKGHYSLKFMPTLAYLRDPRFKCLGCSVSIDGGPVKWLDGYDTCKEFFDRLSKVPNVTMVAHNCNFDGALAYEIFNYKPAKFCCTMFMARYLIGNGILPDDIGVALKDIAQFVDNEKMHLDEALEDGTLDTYAIRDCEICRDFYYKYKDVIPTDETAYIDMHVQMSAVPKFMLNEELLQGVVSTEERRAALYPKVRKDDFLVAAFKALGVNVEYKTTAKGNKKAAFSKTDDFMKSLLRHPDKRVAELAKLRLEAYSTCERSKAGRFLTIGSPMTCPLVYYAAHTGRSGGSDMVNVQNLPRGSALRVSLCAPEGHKLVIIDSSQIEVRMLAFLAGEEKLLNAFRDGVDPYKLFASNELFHKPIDEITKSERQTAKPAVLACGYGQSGNGLAAYAKRMGIELSNEIADKCVRAYRAAYPAITGGLNKSSDGYWQRCERFVKDNGYLLLPSGRKITYPNLHIEQGELVFTKPKIFMRDVSTNRVYGSLLVENATQAAARDLVFWQVKQVLDKCPTAQIALAVHDEAVIVVPEDLAENYLAVAEECFKSAPAWATGIPVQGEGHISDCYDK